MNRFIKLLQDGDLRTTGNVKKVIQMVMDQKDFDQLMDALFSGDRGTIMRAADAIEKITLSKPGYLIKHHTALLRLLPDAKHIELKWHLAQLIPRLALTPKETKQAWDILFSWVTNTNESRIVRVNSLQALFEIAQRKPELIQSFRKLAQLVEHGQTPSLAARIKKLRKVAPELMM